MSDDDLEFLGSRSINSAISSFALPRQRRTLSQIISDERSSEFEASTTEKRALNRASSGTESRIWSRESSSSYAGMQLAPQILWSATTPQVATSQPNPGQQGAIISGTKSDGQGMQSGGRATPERRSGINLGEPGKCPTQLSVEGYRNLFPEAFVQNDKVSDSVEDGERQDSNEKVPPRQAAVSQQTSGQSSFGATRSITGQQASFPPGVGQGRQGELLRSGSHIIPVSRSGGQLDVSSPQLSPHIQGHTQPILTTTTQDQMAAIKRLQAYKAERQWNAPRIPVSMEQMQQMQRIQQARTEAQRRVQVLAQAQAQAQARTKQMQKMQRGQQAQAEALRRAHIHAQGQLRAGIPVYQLEQGQGQEQGMLSQSARKASSSAETAQSRAPQAEVTLVNEHVYTGQRPRSDNRPILGPTSDNQLATIRTAPSPQQNEDEVPWNPPTRRNPQLATTSSSTEPGSSTPIPIAEEQGFFYQNYFPQQVNKRIGCFFDKSFFDRSAGIWRVASSDNGRDTIVAYTHSRCIYPDSGEPRVVAVWFAEGSRYNATKPTNPRKPPPVHVDHENWPWPREVWREQEKVAHRVGALEARFALDRILKMKRKRADFNFVTHIVLCTSYLNFLASMDAWKWVFEDSMWKLTQKKGRNSDGFRCPFYGDKCPELCTLLGKLVDLRQQQPPIRVSFRVVRRKDVEGATEMLRWRYGRLRTDEIDGN
jgi:hypothetical protein